MVHDSHEFHTFFISFYLIRHEQRRSQAKKRNENKKKKSITIPLAASRQCGQPSSLNPVSRFGCTKKNNKGKENKMKRKSRRYRRGTNAEAEAQYDLNSKNYSDPVS